MSSSISSRSKRWIGRALGAALFVGCIAGISRDAEAVVVERIVAIIGEKPILLSDLRNRAKPFLAQIQQAVPEGAQRAAAQSQILKELLQKMVEEELEGQAAARANITVPAEEVDAAIDNISSSQGLTREQLFKEARTRNGMTEQEYRDELRRQILESKMVQLRVKGHARITEEDIKTMFDRVVREEKKRREYHPAWIVLRILPDSTDAAIEERMKLAKQIVATARKDEDFGTLAKTHSDDAATRDVGGDLGVRVPNGSPQAAAGRPVLGDELEAVIAPLEPGEVAEPIRIGQAILVMKLLTRQPSRYKTLQEARGEMIQRLQAEILDKAKRKWLEELKRRTHVDVRL